MCVSGRAGAECGAVWVCACRAATATADDRRCPSVLLLTTKAEGALKKIYVPCSLGTLSFHPWLGCPSLLLHLYTSLLCAWVSVFFLSYIHEAREKGLARTGTNTGTPREPLKENGLILGFPLLSSQGIRRGMSCQRMKRQEKERREWKDCEVA